MEHFVTTIALVGIVIIAASLLSGPLERSGAPLVAVFIALGAVLGPWGLGFLNVRLGSPILQVLATLGLALVLFSDAITIEMSALRAQWKLAWRVLVPGTLLPALITSAAAYVLLDLPAPAAAILGAALSSTDPVLLRTLLRSRALPPTTRLALRLETGMNDVVLLPIIVIAMLLLRDGGALPRAEVARSVLGLFVLGPVLGALVGWVGIIALVRVRTRVGVRRDYESMYALGLAFTGYAAAEAVGGSGFIAAFAAGLMVGAQDVELCDCFLEYGEATAEMLLLLTFVALGTSLIWSGLAVIEPRTLLVAAIALFGRTIVIYPMLFGVVSSPRERRLIALFGPRGLSSLLFTLLPVFVGVPGAERLFTVACLVVLLSVVLHGGGIGLFLRAREHAAGPASGTLVPASAVAPVAREMGTARDGLRVMAGEERARGAEDLPERIRVEEAQERQARGEPVIVVDARADRSYHADDLQAKGAVRMPPDDPVRAATVQRLSQHATLVVYCA